MSDSIFNRLAPAICDSHVHVGRWSEGHYYSPLDVVKKLRSLGIQKWVVSSTSAIDDDFNQVRIEFESLLVLAPENTIPLLWVTPKMASEPEYFSKYEGIPFRGLKIHGFSNKWDLEGDTIRCMLDVARKRDLPVLIHTGWTPESEAGNYSDICHEFADVNIILAHGRPLDQTIQVMKDNENVYVDTAYMSEEDVGAISQVLGNDRILFGTDFPLDEYYYPGELATERYKKRVTTLVEMFGEDIFLVWANDNFHKVFRR